jgi:O-antigen ligase
MTAVPELERRALKHWWAIAAALSGVTVAVAPSTGVALGAVLLSALIWKNFSSAQEIAAVSVLALRPALDIFSDRSVEAGGFAVSPGVLFGMVTLLVSVIGLTRRLLSRKQVWPDRGMGWCHFLLAAAYACGLGAGIMRAGMFGLLIGVRETTRAASVVGGFLVVFWWLSEDQTRRPVAWKLLIAGLVIPIIVAIWQLATGGGFEDPGGFRRINGTLAHPNTLGVFLVPFVLLTLSGIESVGWRHVVLRMLSASLLTAIIALTFSRTALLVLLTALLMLAVLHGIRSRRLLVGRATFVVAAFALLGWLFLGPLIRQRFAGLNIDSGLLRTPEAIQASEDSFQWRLLNWAVLIAVGREQPLFGHGVGMTRELNPLVSPDKLVPFDAHNDFVRFFFEAGLVGLVCYVAYTILLCWWTFWLSRRASISEVPKAVAICSSVTAIYVVTGGLTEVSLNTPLQLELYALLALMACFARQALPKASPIELGHAGAQR